MNRVRFGVKADAQVIRNVHSDQKALVKGVFKVECFDKDGHLKWVEENSNLVTDEGLDALLDVMFHGLAATGTWYVAIIESNTAAASGMTYAVPTYTESEAYAEGTRPAYVESAASSQSIDNSASKAVFTMNATKTIYGASLVSDNTKGDVAASPAYLYCYSLFSSSKAVVNLDVLNVQITLTAADV